MAFPRCEEKPSRSGRAKLTYHCLGEDRAVVLVHVPECDVEEVAHCVGTIRHEMVSRGPFCGCNVSSEDDILTDHN